MKSKFIFFFLFVQCSFMSAQTININTVEVCAGQEVLIPVTGESLPNVGAITLYIGFDTLNLTFDSIINIDPQLIGISANMMSLPSQLAFAWSNTSPINLLNNKLFDIRFFTNGQTAQVMFNTGCEIADPAGIVIPAYYTNGAINNGSPLVTLQPEDTSIVENNSATFTVSSPNAISYFWRESQDHGTSWLALEDGDRYFGTHTPELMIFPVPLSFNNNQYQCVLTRGNCQTVSLPGTLAVDAMTSTGNIPGSGYKEFSIFPVPFNGNPTVEFTLEENCDVVLQTTDCIGNKISEIYLPSQSRGNHHIQLNTSGWGAGVYFVTSTIISPEKKKFRTLKIIKTVN